MKRIAATSLVVLAFAGVGVSEATAALPPNPKTHFGVGNVLRGKVVLRNLRNLGFRIVVPVQRPTIDQGVDGDENPPWTWTQRHLHG
jgi:hypothetical protein